ncbi:sulfur carrier protein ThiS [bacterium]|nr:sulfur carrier protein ThiS [bacterium]
MKIEVNREIIQFNGDTISDLIKEQGKNGNSGLVVVVNGTIVLKNQWDIYKLKEADSIFIIIPAEGG